MSSLKTVQPQRPLPWAWWRRLPDVRASLWLCALVGVLPATSLRAQTQTQTPPPAQTPSQTRESGLSPEERLQAIRQGLVQAALDGATHVESLAWIDEQGALRESSSFRSGMQVRGVQVLAYLRDTAGQPQAQLQLPEVAPAGQLVAPVANAACAAEPGLRHLLGLQVRADGWSTDTAPLAQRLAHLSRDWWLQAGADAAAWRMLRQAPLPASMYEQVLLGSGADQLPWHAVLTVQPAPPSAVHPAADPLLSAAAFRVISWRPVERPVMARIQLSVTARGQTQPLWLASADVSLTSQAQAWAAPTLTTPTRDQLSALLQPWAQSLGQRMACQDVRPRVLQVQAGSLRINAGALAGVQAGDEWLLADPQRFPQQMLASGVASQNVLARVQQVSAHEAQLQVLAGAAVQVRPDWRAWPTQTLSRTPVVQ